MLLSTGEQVSVALMAMAIDSLGAKAVSLTGAQIEDMYHVMAIANYEDRFVIPTGHREDTEDMYDERGSCGFSFGNGCSSGETKTNMFGGPSRKKLQTPTPHITGEVF